MPESENDDPSKITPIDRALLEAAADADLAAVRASIAQGADLNVFIPLKNRAFMGARMGTAGNTALGIAIRERASEGNFLDLSDHSQATAPEREAEARRKRATLLEIVEELTKAGADLNFVSTAYQGRSPWCAAAANNDVEVLELFLRHGAKVQGTGAIHHAATEGSVEAVKLLLARGCDANEKRNGKTALEFLKAWSEQAGKAQDLELNVGEEVAMKMARQEKERQSRREVIAEILRKQDL